jgi:hypothetical protein
VAEYFRPVDHCRFPDNVVSWPANLVRYWALAG